MNSSLPESPDPEFGKIFLNPEAHKQNGEQSLFVDGHVDLPHYMRHHAPMLSLTELDHGPFTLEKAKESGVRLFAAALYCEDRYNGEKAFQHLQDILQFTVERFDHATIIKNAEDLRRIKEVPDQLGTLLLLENADALAGNPAYVERLKETGISIVGLTHAGKNRLADGNEVACPDGVTKEGGELVRALKENGIIIDVAHLHPKCFWQLLELFEGMIITSHTGVKTLCDLPRNIDFDQAGEILARGGVIGITFNPEMLSPAGKGSEEQVFVHMDTLVQKFGPDGIGIGSDLCGFAPVPGGLEDISGISGLIDIMRGHGYADEAVKRIMGLNWLRVYETLVKERG
jgi:membrane dipeptidase